MRNKPSIVHQVEVQLDPEDSFLTNNCFKAWKIYEDFREKEEIQYLNKKKVLKTLKIKESKNFNQEMNEKFRHADHEYLTQLTPNFDPMFNFKRLGQNGKAPKTTVFTEVQKLHPCVQDFFLFRQPRGKTIKTFGNVPIYTCHSNWKTGNSRHLRELNSDIEDLLHFGVNIRSLIFRLHRITNCNVTYWRELTNLRKRMV